MTLFNSLFNTVLQRHVPLDELSRVSAVQEIGAKVVQPIGQAGIGIVAAQLGTDHTLLLAAVLQVLTVIAVVQVGAVRRLRC